MHTTWTAASTKMATCSCLALPSPYQKFANERHISTHQQASTVQHHRDKLTHVRNSSQASKHSPQNKGPHQVVWSKHLPPPALLGSPPAASCAVHQHLLAVLMASQLGAGLDAADGHRIPDGCVAVAAAVAMAVALAVAVGVTVASTTRSCFPHVHESQPRACQ